jgi:beta-galactosidase
MRTIYLLCVLVVLLAGFEVARSVHVKDFAPPTFSYVYGKNNPAVNNRTFVVMGDSWAKDGKPFRILSGAFHYFRSLPELWMDRLIKMKAGGLNAVETYVSWNLHQPKNADSYDFTGRLDIVKFVQYAHKVGLLVIIRPPPYICAEWEFGGFPGWLLSDSKVHLRCDNQQYMFYTKRFLNALLPQLQPLQYHLGGPIILVQIENEYGSYGSDHNYMQGIIDTVRKNGIETVLFSSNGVSDMQLQGGAVKEVVKTANYGIGTDVDWTFNTLRRYQTTGPLFNTEYWVGWFDAWTGSCHNIGDPIAASLTLLETLYLNASVNLYMYHGGTSFGFMSGANGDQGTYYSPQVTSYDYDAPINEAGDLTFKFYLFKEIFTQLNTDPLPELPAPTPKKAYGRVSVSKVAKLLDPTTLGVLSPPPLSSAFPLQMEDFDQYYGFIFYKTTLAAIGTQPVNVTLYFNNMKDRAQVFLDGAYQGTVWRGDSRTNNVPLQITKPGQELSVLVENTGRINFGAAMETERKGLLQPFELNGQWQFRFSQYSLPLSDLTPISTINEKFAPRYDNNDRTNEPTFWRGYLDIDTVADTFLDMSKWVKGVIWVNGFNLGRYWNAGPQVTNYVPWPLLKKGRNEIILLELHHFNGTESDTPHLQFVNQINLGKNC